MECLRPLGGEGLDIEGRLPVAAGVYVLGPRPQGAPVLLVGLDPPADHLAYIPASPIRRAHVVGPTVVTQDPGHDPDHILSVHVGGVLEDQELPGYGEA